MGKIFYIMGKSSSGKDTIFRELSGNYGINLRTVVPYTTRPIREGEKNGVQYFFTDEEGLEQIRREGRLIELRSYDTCHGVWKYFTVNDEQIDLEKYDYLMIGTLDSFLAVQKFYGKDMVIPVFIELDDGIRLQRALNREKKQPCPKYEEMCRRFLADAKDFAPEKMEAAGITKRFYNDDLGHCVEEIKEYIRLFS